MGHHVGCPDAVDASLVQFEGFAVKNSPHVQYRSLGDPGVKNRSDYQQESFED